MMSKDDQEEAEFGPQQSQAFNEVDPESISHFDDHNIHSYDGRNREESFQTFTREEQKNRILSEDPTKNNVLASPRRNDESELMLYDDVMAKAPDSRRKRSFNDELNNFIDEYEYSGEPYSIQKRADKIEPSRDDVELLEISNALEQMVNTKYNIDRTKVITEKVSLDDLMMPIPEITTTEIPITRPPLNIEEDFSDVLDFEKSLDTTIPPLIEITTASDLLTQIPQISRKPIEVVTTLEDLLASAPVETSYRVHTMNTKLEFLDDFDSKNDKKDSEEAETTTTVCKKIVKEKTTIPMKPFTVHTKKHTTPWDQVIYPLEIQSMEPDEDDEEETEGCIEVNTERRVPTVQECRATTKVVKIMEESKENDTEYYVDIVIPYDTDEQQQYIDRLVKREEPSDFIDYSERVRRDNDERQIWKEFNWPEHKNYGSSGALATTEKEIEVLDIDEEAAKDQSDEKQIWKEFKLSGNQKYGSSLTSTESKIEALSDGSEERPIWNVFKWPEHKKYGGSYPETSKELNEKADIMSKQKADDRQIWKEFNWPEHRKYSTLTSTEKRIEIQSNGNSGDRQIWNEFKWPEHRKYDSSGVGSLTSTEKNIEVLTSGMDGDADNWEEFNWPDQNVYKEPIGQTFTTGRMSLTRGRVGQFGWPKQKESGMSVSSSTGRTMQNSDWRNEGSNGIWQRFRWPEHKEYGRGTSTTKPVSSSSPDYLDSNKNIWEQFNWPQNENYESVQNFPLLGTEIPSKNGLEGYESEMGIAERPSIGDNSVWSYPSEVPAKTQVTVADKSAEWNEFNSPSPHSEQSESSEFNNVPAKQKVTLPGAEALIPMDESEKLEYSTRKSYDKNFADSEGLENFDWSAKSTTSSMMKDTAGPHVMNTVLWEKLHLPFHKSAHMKIIPATTSSNNEHLTLERLGRGTTENVGIWNRFQWPEHKKYTSGVTVTESIPMIETVFWDEIPLSHSKHAHLKTIGGSTSPETQGNGKQEETGIWQKFNWPEHRKYHEGGTTKKPESWDKLQFLHSETAHLKVVDNSGSTDKSGKKGDEPKVLEEITMTSTSFTEIEPMDRETANEEEIVGPIVKERKHTTKIIENSFKPEELTSKTYILEGTDAKTTTDIWEAFQWPPPRTHLSNESSIDEQINVAAAPEERIPENITAISDLENQLELPAKTFDLFAFPSSDLETNQSDIILPDIPVPPFPTVEEYDEYSLFSTPWSSHEEEYRPSGMKVMSELNVPLSHDQEKESFSLPPDKLFTSSEGASVGPLYSMNEFSLEPEKKHPFWDQPRKKGHHPKTSTTEGFPTKHTSPPTKSTTIGERLELAEEVHYKKHEGPSTEPTLHGPIKVAPDKTLHTPVRESEDDDNLWDFRVLSEEEVVTFHPKTKKPTQKKTTIYSFKPIGTTADDWEVFNEPPKEEITKPITKSTVTEEKKTTFYVVITQPTEPIEPYENVGETEKTFMLEPPPPIAPPGAVESSTEYYDEDVEEVTPEDYEENMFFSNREQTFPTPKEKEETLQEITEETAGVEDFETVTFRVSEVFVGSTESRPSLVAETPLKSEENVELVTFRPFESYPTPLEKNVPETVKKTMEDLKEQNNKESLVDSLELEMVTFRKPQPPKEKNTIETPHISLTEMEIWKGDEDNLLYALTETPKVSLEREGKVNKNLLVEAPLEAGEGTTKIIEGDRIITEPYDHRSMSIPFNEKLEGASDIMKEINKSEDSNDTPPPGPLSDLAADFMREQSDLVNIRDPYSIIERPLYEKKNRIGEDYFPSVEEREQMRMDESLKSPFTEENLEEDVATALREPERLEPGKAADEDSRKKSKHLLESLEGPSVLEELKKKLSHLRAKPITAGGGNENDGIRGKEFLLGDSTSAVPNILDINFTYPEAVEAVIAVEKTTGISLGPENHLVEGATKSDEKKITAHKAKDKFEDLIDLEGILERSGLTESHFEEATTIPDILTPLLHINQKEEKTTEKSQLSSVMISPSESSNEIVTPLDELLTDFHVQEQIDLATTMDVEVLTEMKENGGPDSEEVITEKSGDFDFQHSSFLGEGATEVILTSSSRHETSKSKKIDEHTTMAEIEKLLDLQKDLEKPETTTYIGMTSMTSVEEEPFTEGAIEEVEDILRTLDEFEISPESYTTEPVTEERREHSTLVAEGISYEMEMIGATSHGLEITSEMKVPPLLTPLLMVEEEHVTGPSVLHRTTTTEYLMNPIEFSTKYQVPTIQPSTTLLSEEDLSLVTPFLNPDHFTTQPPHLPEKTTETHNEGSPQIFQIEKSIEEGEEEIESNLAHLPKDMHETSTICEICDQLDESGHEISTVKNQKGLKGKEPTVYPEENEKEAEKERVSHPPQVSEVITIGEELTTPSGNMQEEFDANLIHMPKVNHETSTICEICDEEPKIIEHFSEGHPGVTTSSGISEKLENMVGEKGQHTETVASPHFTEAQTISLKEEQIEEFDSNLHHLPEEHLHETSTICEICTEEDLVPLEKTLTSSVGKLTTLKLHPTSEIETRTILETETTSELSKHEKQEQEEFQINLHHFPEHHAHETSTICEICDEEVEDVSHNAPYSKMVTSPSHGKGFKSSQSPGEHDKGFSKNLPEETTERFLVQEEMEVSTSVQEIKTEEIDYSHLAIETTSGIMRYSGTHGERPYSTTEEKTTELSYNFDGKEIEQPILTTQRNIFKVGQYSSSISEGVTDLTSGNVPVTEIEPPFTIEEVESTEHSVESGESTVEDHINTKQPESSMDEGLKAAEKIEEKLKEMIKTQEMSSSTEYLEPEITLQEGIKTETKETTTIVAVQEHSTDEFHSENKHMETISFSKGNTSELNTEIPTQINFYTEFQPTVSSEPSSTRHGTTLHFGSTSEAMLITTEEMVQVQQELEKIEEVSKTSSEGLQEVATPTERLSSAAETLSPSKEHTKIETEDLEEKKTTGMDNEVSALLKKNMENIQEEIFLSSLGIEEGTQPGEIATIAHTSEELKLESEEASTSNIDENITKEEKTESSEGEIKHLDHTVGIEHTTTNVNEAVNEKEGKSETTSSITVTQASMKELEEVNTESAMEDSEGRTTRIDTEVSGLLENLEDIEEKIFISTLDVQKSTEAMHAETASHPFGTLSSTGETIQKESSHTEHNFAIDHSEENLEKGEEPEENTSRFTQLESVPSTTSPTHEKSEEEAATNFYTPESYASTTLKSEVLIPPETSSTVTHIREESASKELPPSETFLSQNVEKKLEDLNEVVNELLMSTPGSPFGGTENFEDQITESFLLEKELEELNKEFIEMLKTTISAKDLLEGLEKPHGVSEGTSQISTGAPEQIGEQPTKYSTEHNEESSIPGKGNGHHTSVKAEVEEEITNANEAYPVEKSESTSISTSPLISTAIGEKEEFHEISVSTGSGLATAQNMDHEGVGHSTIESEVTAAGGEELEKFSSAQIIEEITSSPVLQYTTSSSELGTHTGKAEASTNPIIGEHHEVAPSERIDTKLDELNEVLEDILNSSSAPHLPEGESRVEEEITESQILEEKLQELNEEFQQILKTTRTSEEILEDLVGAPHSTSKKTLSSMMELTTSAFEPTEGGTSNGYELGIHSTEDVSGSTTTIGKTADKITEPLGPEAGSHIETSPIAVVTEEQLQEITNFYTAIVTAETEQNELSSHFTSTSEVAESGSHISTEVSTESLEELITNIHLTEAPTMKTATKTVTDKLEEKLEELDELINEFLSSTASAEAISENPEAHVEENIEEEVLEKELKELKQEFQLMLSTTIAPDDLLEAVEEVLSPKTEHTTEVTAENLKSMQSEKSQVSPTLTSEGNIGETTSSGDIHEESHSEIINTEHSTVNEMEEKIIEGGHTQATAVITEISGTHSTRVEGHEQSSTTKSEMITFSENETHQSTKPFFNEKLSNISVATETEFKGAAGVTEINTASSKEGQIEEGTKTIQENPLSTVLATVYTELTSEEGEVKFTESQKKSTTLPGLPSEVESEKNIIASEATSEMKTVSEAHGVTVTGSGEEAEEPSSTKHAVGETVLPEKSSESEANEKPESGVTKPHIQPSRNTVKSEQTPETVTTKMHSTEGLSSISLLTTLLLSLVTSTTQSPEKNNTVSSHFASNVSGPQNIPKCLVVFITGESPLLPLNGTKWVPSECPRLGEESTTPSNIMTPTQGTTEISNAETTLASHEGATNESPSSTTELTTTTLLPVEELPEIKSNNFVEDGCTEADFENNNKCFCMLDVTVDHVADDLEGANSSKANGIKCSKFLKVNKGLVMRNETSSNLKRSRRSYLYLRYLNRQRRETVEYNKIDEVLANELTTASTDTTIYAAVGATATIPCIYKDEVIEREHFMKYIWTAEGERTIIFSDRVREATDGALKISEVTVEDESNYTCSINRPFGNTDSERKHFVHELLIIERPIFKVRSTVMYDSDEPCSLKDGDVVHAYLPKMLEDLLCGIHKRVCKVEMERPSCVEVEEKTYLTVKYIVTLDGLSTLIPSISSSDCDFNCQMKVMGSVVSLLIKNVETTSVLDVISQINSFNHTFKPREVKFPSDRSAVEDVTLLPKLVIGCPAGFGIQRSTNKICVACPRNTYNSENSSMCSPCPRVHYQPKMGSSSCIECKTPFDDKACVGMMFANKAFLILYVGSSVAIVFFLLLCIFCAQSSTQAAFGGPQKKKRAQTPKRRRIGRKDVEDPAEKPLLPKDPSVPKIVKGPKVPPPDF